MAGKSFSARASQKPVHQSARKATCANDAGGGCHPGWKVPQSSRFKSGFRGGFRGFFLQEKAARGVGSDAEFLSNWSGRVLEDVEVRVFLEKNAYYNHSFRDEDQWLSLMASSPELEEPIFVYANRNDPELLTLLKIPPNGPGRYTVTIRSLNNSHLKSQFVISKFICEGWVKP
jgi:hypothetical protein